MLNFVLNFSESCDIGTENDREDWEKEEEEKGK